MDSPSTRQTAGAMTLGLALTLLALGVLGLLPCLAGLVSVVPLWRRTPTRTAV